MIDGCLHTFSAQLPLKLRHHLIMWFKEAQMKCYKQETEEKIETKHFHKISIEQSGWPTETGLTAQT